MFTFPFKNRESGIKFFQKSSCQALENRKCPHDFDSQHAVLLRVNSASLYDPWPSGLFPGPPCMLKCLRHWSWEISLLEIYSNLWSSLEVTVKCLFCVFWLVLRYFRFGGFRILPETNTYLREVPSEWRGSSTSGGGQVPNHQSHSHWHQTLT